MRNIINRYCRSLAVLMFLAIIASSTASIWFMSGMTMSENEMTTSCLFMMEDKLLCRMSAVDYIKAWKNMFVSIHAGLLLVIVALIATSHKRQLVRNSVFAFFIEQRKEISVEYFLHELMREGRLRPKIY